MSDKSLFTLNLTRGQKVQVQTANSTQPLEVVWDGTDGHFFKIILDDGRGQIMPVSQLVSVTFTPQTRPYAEPRPKVKMMAPEAQTMAPAAPELPESLKDSPIMQMEIGRKGVLKSIGNVFGYIRRDDVPEDLFFYTNQLRQLPGDAPVQPGDPLVYTLGQNKKGSVAYTIHRPGTVADIVRVMDTLDPNTQYMDLSNLAKQILDATGDEEAVTALLDARHARVPAKAKDADARQFGVDVDDILSKIAAEEDIEPRILLRAERKANLQQETDEYQKTANTLLEYAIRHAEQPYFSGAIYQLFTRIIKNLGPTLGMPYIELAGDYYERRGEERPTAYFRALKAKAEADTDV